MTRCATPVTPSANTADRLVGANGALIARYDELIHAKTAHLADQQAQRRARAHATAQQLAAAPPAKTEQAYRDGSAGRSPAVPMEGDPRESDDRVQRRDTLTLGLAVAATPDVLGKVLADASAEAMEFTQLTGLSAVGQGTLEHLELAIIDLNWAYSKDPPAEQFVVARAYRSRVNGLIRGRHTLKELRELYVYAARCCQDFD
ncbi:MAG: hypothetical protein ACRDQ4_13805 [Pseudonocardiaceae bacterium]